MGVARAIGDWSYKKKELSPEKRAIPCCPDIKKFMIPKK